jgi:phage tail-like protein
MARRTLDPYANFRFRLELNNVQVAGFAECSGLSMETKVFEYNEGGRNETTLKFPETTTYGNITLKRGVTQSNDLIEWQRDIVEGRFERNPRPPRDAKRPRPANQNRAIAIVLQNELGNDVKRWSLINAFPVKWLGPDLKAAGTEVAFETLEIAHEGVQPG